jgi:ATP-binding cassette subfamily B protein
VLISHRFSSVRMADRILVLADGEVEAVGTHEELLAEGGRYAELFELQATGYR